MILEFLQFALFGLVAGALARLVHPGRDPVNWVWTMVLGMAGALLGGWVGGFIGLNTDQFVVRWVSAVAGGVLLLVLYHLATARRRAAGGPAPAGAATSDDYKKAVSTTCPAGQAGRTARPAGGRRRSAVLFALPRGGRQAQGPIQAAHDAAECK